MSDIPTHLFREMLSRVPVEPLLRFKCVCKKWYFIINDPDFTRLHLQRQTDNQQRLIIQDLKGTELFTFPLDSINISKRCEFVEAKLLKTPISGDVPYLCDLPVASCHGLILISQYDFTEIWVLWNPFTREYYELPKFEDLTTMPYGGSSLAVWGLGFDYNSDDYKVVRISQASNCGNDCLETLVYSLKLNYWRRVDDFLNCILPSMPCVCDRGVSVSGRLHWIVFVGHDNGIVGITVSCIIYFDLGLEKHGLLTLPLGIYDEEPNRLECLDALGECLLMSRSNTRGGLTVWVLNSYTGDNMWSKLFSFPESPNINYIASPRPIAYLKNEGRVLVEYNTCEFMWVDVKKKHAEKVVVEGISGYFSCQVFTASLIGLMGNKGASELVTLNGGKKRKLNSGNNRLKLKITSSYVCVPPEDWFV